MGIKNRKITVSTNRSGLYEVTAECQRLVDDAGIEDGLLVVFCRHTSASLVLMENADPSARHDLEEWLHRLVDPHDPHFTHIHEGLDDMPSHIKMALTRSSETIPVTGGRLLLGTWQGVFLWEHRAIPHARELVLSVVS